MPARIVSLFRPATRSIIQSPITSRHITRSLSTTGARLEAAGQRTQLPAYKPVGAFRGGLLGFLAGSALAGGSIYYYIVRDYMSMNEQLMADIYTLQTATQHLNTYVLELEGMVNKVDRLTKR